MTSQTLISKIHCTLSANQKRDSEYNKMYLLRPKQFSRLVTLGYLCLTPKGARQAARRRLQTNSTAPTGRLEMNSWGNNNNNELY